MKYISNLILAMAREYYDVGLKTKLILQFMGRVMGRVLSVASDADASTEDGRARKVWGVEIPAVAG